MTDKEKIRAEIERRMKASAKIEEEYKGIDKDLSAKAQLKAAEYQSMLFFIESMQEEPVSEGLDDAAFDYAESCKYDGGEKLLCVEHFKAGANWQKKQDQETIELAEDHAMLAGMEKMKEQMMAKAFDFTEEHNTACVLASECLRVHGWFNIERDFNDLFRHLSCVDELFKGKFRGKTKVIVIKED